MHYRGQYEVQFQVSTGVLSLVPADQEEPALLLLSFLCVHAALTPTEWWFIKNSPPLIPINTPITLTNNPYGSVSLLGPGHVIITWTQESRNPSNAETATTKDLQHVKKDRFGFFSFCRCVIKLSQTATRHSGRPSKKGIWFCHFMAIFTINSWQNSDIAKIQFWWFLPKDGDFNFLPSFCLCVCTHVWWPGSNSRSQLSPSTVWVLGTELGSSVLVGKCLYPLSHFAGPYFHF